MQKCRECSYLFQANKELRVTKTATRADEKLDLISLDEYLKKLNMTISPNDPENRMMAEKKAEEMKVAVAEKHRILPHNELSIND